MLVSRACSRLSSILRCTGVDAVCSSGEFWYYGGVLFFFFFGHIRWSSLDISCVFSSPNFVMCNIVEVNGIISYVMFFYGAPLLSDRKEV